MTYIIMGADPGVTGALAFYDCDSGQLIIEDMPTLELKVGKSIKKRINLYELARIIDVHAENIARAVVENPSAMPGQGVSELLSASASPAAPCKAQSPPTSSR